MSTSEGGIIFVPTVLLSVWLHPDRLLLRLRRLRFDWVRTPHDTTLSDAPSAHRPLDDWCGGGRDQHGVPRRQLPRGLFLSGESFKGRFAGRNPVAPPE